MWDYFKLHTVEIIETFESLLSGSNSVKLLLVNPNEEWFDIFVFLFIKRLMNKTAKKTAFKFWI